MKQKAKYIYFLPLGAAFLVLICLNIFCHDRWLDSDMAAEMIFSRLLRETGHLFATPDWYYSTEFRFLYTQLIMAPLFRVTGSWHLIRAAANITAYVLMVVSCFYMMKPLKVKTEITALTAAILLLPFSETMLTHMQMGNTYMPHVIILFFFFGMYLRLVNRKEYGRGRRREIFVCFLLLSVICGVSGVRYLLAMQCPLMIAAVPYAAGSEEFQSFRRQFGENGKAKAQIRNLVKSERMGCLYYSLAGAAAGVAGYAVNVLWVSRKYVFQTYEATNFIPVYQGILWERVQNAFGSLLMFFGYIPEKGFLSLRGLISILSFVMTALFGYGAARACKTGTGARRFTAVFAMTALILNLFVFVFTTSTMVPRYYITIWIFFLPLLAFCLEGRDPLLDRLALGGFLALCLCVSSAKVTLSYLTTDKNEDKRAVAAFLAEEGRNFGYATYWNANIITELTDGAVEVANILDPESLAYFTWSSPVRYYEEGYHRGEVFLLLTAEEAAEYADAKALQTGEQIYNDGKYVVRIYDSAEALISCGE